MKYIAVIFCLLVAFQSSADERLAFSPYSKSLKLAAVKENNFREEFKGTIKLSGVLRVYFEQDEAYFRPSEASRAKMPQVVSGPHPATAESILVGNGTKLLNRLLTKREAIDLLMQKTDFFESPAIVTLKNYRTWVECDSRAYGAQLVSISLIKAVEPQENGQNGCANPAVKRDAALTRAAPYFRR